MTDTPRVDSLIDEVMAKHASFAPHVQAAYYEAVHQALAPLARELERRVKELERETREALLLARAECDRADAAELQLATLKQSQGEPVAWIDEFGNVFPASWYSDGGYAKADKSRFRPLYTSAPTIPRDVDEELASAESLIAKISGSALLAGEKCHKDDKSLLYKTACDALITVGYARSLLSAAPKPGEPS